MAGGRRAAVGAWPDSGAYGARSGGAGVCEWGPGRRGILQGGGGLLAGLCPIPMASACVVHGSSSWTIHRQRRRPGAEGKRRQRRLFCQVIEDKEHGTTYEELLSSSNLGLHKSSRKLIVNAHEP